MVSVVFTTLALRVVVVVVVVVPLAHLTLAGPSSQKAALQVSANLLDPPAVV